MKPFIIGAFQEAVNLAIELHQGQTRKGTDIPYIAHVFSVAALVMEQGGSQAAVLAALLHDAAEDQGGLAVLEKIKHQFGNEVAEIVLGCSDTITVPKPPWRQRKEEYLAHLAAAPEAVLLVSWADKLHNARAILADYRLVGEELWKRFNGGKDGTLWYYRALLAEYQKAALPREQVMELARVITALEVLVWENEQHNHEEGPEKQGKRPRFS